MDRGYSARRVTAAILRESGRGVPLGGELLAVIHDSKLDSVKGGKEIVGQGEREGRRERERGMEGEGDRAGKGGREGGREGGR